MNKFILKTVVLLLIISLNWTGLSVIGETLAYFFDKEDSNANACQAGTLNFSLRSGQNNFVPLETALNMKPGDSVARDIYIKKEGSLPFKYTAVSESVGGVCDLELYDALQLKIWYNWYDATPTEPNYHNYRHMDLKYDGPLKDFDLRALNPDDPDLQIPNSHPYFENVFYGPDEHWFYSSQIILPEAVSAELQNKSCQFKFVFDGWQINLPDSSSGFSDTEEILSTIATGDWTPDVTVIYPNGGEVWYLVPGGPAWSDWCQAHGMNENCEYPIEWSAINTIGPDLDLLIDIHYSVDSGGSWMAQVADDTDNDGIYWWKPPYDMSYATDQGRIKVEATHKDYSFLTNWDMSDADFCPPMLTLEDLLGWDESIEEEIITIDEADEGDTGDESDTSDEGDISDEEFTEAIGPTSEEGDEGSTGTSGSTGPADSEDDEGSSSAEATEGQGDGEVGDNIGDAGDTEDTGEDGDSEGSTEGDTEDGYDEGYTGGETTDAVIEDDTGTVGDEGTEGDSDANGTDEGDVENVGDPAPDDAGQGADGNDSASASDDATADEAGGSGDSGDTGGDNGTDNGDNSGVDSIGEDSPANEPGDIPDSEGIQSGDDGGSDGGDTGDGLDSGNLGESGGESSGDSGDAGDSVSE